MWEAPIPDYFVDVLRMKILIDCRSKLVRRGYTSNKDEIAKFCLDYANILSARLRFNGYAPVYPCSLPKCEEDLRKLYSCDVRCYNETLKTIEGTPCPDLERFLGPKILSLWGTLEVFMAKQSMEAKTPEILMCNLDKWPMHRLFDFANFLDKLEPLYKESIYDGISEKLQRLFDKAYSQLEKVLQFKPKCHYLEITKKQPSIPLVLRGEENLRNEMLWKCEFVHIFHDCFKLIHSAQMIAEKRLMDKYSLFFGFFTTIVDSLTIHLKQTGYVPVMPYCMDNVTTNTYINLCNKEIVELKALPYPDNDDKFAFYLYCHLYYCLCTQIWGCILAYIKKLKQDPGELKGDICNLKAMTCQALQSLMDNLKTIWNIYHKYKRTITPLTKYDWALGEKQLEAFKDSVLRYMKQQKGSTSSVS